MATVYLLILVVVILSLMKIWKQYKYRDFYKIPGPPGLPFIGVLLDATDLKTAVDAAYEWHKQYGPIIRINLGHYEWLLIAEPEMIEFFLKSPKFVDKPYIYDFLKPWLGNGVFTARKFAWHKQRKNILPMFNLKILDNYIQVFNSASDVLVDVMSKQVNEEKCDIAPIITAYTLDIITETAMGLKLNIQINPMRDYIDAVHTMTAIPGKRGLSIWKMHDFLFKFSKEYKEQQNAIKILDDLTLKMIEERKQILSEKCKIDEDVDEYERKRNQIFLDILLKSTIEGKPLSTKELRDEVNSFMFGGHDTTASAIALTFYQLSNNPEVQNLIVDELRDIFGSDSNRTVSMADANEMKYTEMVIKEVLRFYKVVPIFARVLQEDVNYKGTLLPKGLQVLIFLKTLHNSSKHFEEPEKFKPERFLPSNTLPPYSFIPFSAGPRNCQGQKYAMYEMKVAVAKILRKFELLPAGPGHEVDLIPDMVMKPSNGIFLRIKHRQF